MGLDQFAYATKNGNKQDAVEIAYWRKHNALHGYMENLWIKKGRPNGNEERPTEFNCVYLELTLEDIKDLEKTLREEALPETQGFFFGSDSRGDSFKDEQTADFIDEAKQLLLAGGEVCYYSWW
jgi:hypothetical protein